MDRIGLKNADRIGLKIINIIGLKIMDRISLKIMNIIGLKLNISPVYGGKKTSPVIHSHSSYLRMHYKPFCKINGIFPSFSPPPLSSVHYLEHILTFRFSFFSLLKYIFLQM